MNIIETERLFIRQITEKDIAALLGMYNKAENMQFVSSGKCEWTEEELAGKYRKVNRGYESGIGIYAIELKESGEVIGEAGLFDSFNRWDKLELGYIIDSKHWRKGYGKETCLALIHYACTQLHVDSLIARMYAQNLNSVALSEKCGMVKTESGLTDEGKEYLVYEVKSEKYYKNSLNNE